MDNSRTKSRVRLANCPGEFVVSPQLVIFSTTSVTGGLTLCFWFHLLAISPCLRCRRVDHVFLAKPWYLFLLQQIRWGFHLVCLFSHPWRYFISSFAEGREIGGKKCIRSSGLWGAKPSCPNPTGVSTSMAFNAEDWSSRKKTCVEELAYSL